MPKTAPRVKGLSLLPVEAICEDCNTAFPAFSIDTQTEFGLFLLNRN